MNKLVLSTAAVSLALGLASAPNVASAKDRYPMMMTMADMNKDGMVSKEEFLQAMAKMYDENMGKLKAMPATSQAKMMKGDQLTAEGYRKLLWELGGGGR